MKSIVTSFKFLVTLSRYSNTTNNHIGCFGEISEVPHVVSRGTKNKRVLVGYTVLTSVVWLLAIIISVVVFFYNLFY